MRLSLQPLQLLLFAAVSCQAYHPGKKFSPVFETNEDIIEEGRAFRRARTLLEQQQGYHHLSLEEATQNASEDDEVFEHFVAHSDNQTCTADTHAVPFNQQVRGTCLGGTYILHI